MGKKKVKAAFNRELQTFGRRLKMWRQKRGLTQEALAELAKLGYSHLNELENGKTDPGLSTILRLCEALEVNPVVFFIKRAQAEQAQQMWGFETYAEPELLERINSADQDSDKPPQP